MPLVLQNQMSVDITFNGESFPFDGASDLVFIHLAEGYEQALPYLSLALIDNRRWLAQKEKLRVGTKIVLTCTQGDKITERYTFALVAHKVEERPGKIEYRIDATTPIPDYLSRVPTAGIRGSSSHVLKTLAEGAGLTFDGVGTSDTMVWHASGRPLYRFVQYVVDHGYTNESGCLAHAVLAEGVLRYRDITSMDTPVVTLGLQQFLRDGVDAVTSFAPQETAGGANAVGGLAMHAVETNVTGEALHTLHKAVAAQINEEGLLTLDREAKLRITQGRTLHSPVYVTTDVHDAFHRAQYQNARVRMLFNSGVDVVLPVLTRARPLDTVVFDASVGAQQEGAGVLRHSGTYRVFRRVLYIEPGNIRVKLQLLRRTCDALSPQRDTPAPQQNSLITNPSLLRERLPMLPANAGAVLADLQGLATGVMTAASTAGALIAAVSATGRDTTTGVANASEQGSQFLPLMNDTKAGMTALTDSALTDITAIKNGGASAEDKQLQIDARYQAYTQAMESYVASRKPPIRSEAVKAQALATLGEDVATSFTAGDQGLWALTSAAGQIGAALASTSGVASAAATNAAQQQILQTAVTNESVATSATNAAVQARMIALREQSSGWEADLDTLRATQQASVLALKNAP